jgi:hypothetical protein
VGVQLSLVTTKKGEISCLGITIPKPNSEILRRLMTTIDGHQGRGGPERGEGGGRPRASKGEAILSMLEKFQPRSVTYQHRKQNFGEGPVLNFKFLFVESY